MLNNGLWKATEFVWQPAEDGAVQSAEKIGVTNSVAATAVTESVGALKAEAPVSSGRSHPAPSKASAAVAPEETPVGVKLAHPSQADVDARVEAGQAVTAQKKRQPSKSGRGGSAQLPAGTDTKLNPRQYLPSVSGFPGAGVGLYAMRAVVVGAVATTAWLASSRYRGYAPPESTHSI